MSTGGVNLDWIAVYLRELSEDIDAEVIGEYISGLLTVSHDQSGTLCEEVQELLSAYLSPEKSKNAADEIISRYARLVSAVENTVTCTDEIKSVEDQMRNLMKVDCTRVIESPTKTVPSDRDPCTIEVLRSAGVVTYQKDSEEEEELKIAMADSEFLTKQRLNLITTTTTTAASSITTAITGAGVGGILGPSMNGLVDVVSDEESDTDLSEDIENICQYGKKNDFKPGTVEDALAILQPSLATSLQSRQFNMFGGGGGGVGGTSQTKHSSPSPSVRVPNSHVTNMINPPTSQKNSSRPKQAKKKLPPPSKHIARIGAQAEAKRKQNVNSKTNYTDPEVSNKELETARCRREEMEAFLFGDTDTNRKC
ncbi:unnamed protein product [Trichobilharzia szidati]|nr:unnamed protein product [Trichobilharzia szidati]